MARTDETGRSESVSPTEGTPNPVWFKPVMFGFMLVGLAWIIVFNVSNQQYPIQPLGAWNILIGFGLMFIGFIMATRWR